MSRVSLTPRILVVIGLAVAAAFWIGYASRPIAQPRAAPAAALAVDLDHPHQTVQHEPAARPARTADEEAYALALWKVHQSVKTHAARMAFAGLYYKIGEIDRQEVKNRVAPLTDLYRQALDQARAITAPQSLQVQHQRYVEALQLYQQASIDMIKVAEDADDAHLLQAQTQSERASTVVLEIGEELWPGEYKPN